MRIITAGEAGEDFYFLNFFIIYYYTFHHIYRYTSEAGEKFYLQKILLYV